MKPWLLKHLIEIGRVDADGLSQTLRFAVCPGCGQAVLAGLHGRRAALPIQLDPGALTVRGEQLNLIVGTPTYSIVGLGKKYAVGRSVLARNKYPPGKQIVVAEHVCGRTWPDDCYADEPPRPADAEHPPF